MKQCGGNQWWLDDAKLVIRRKLRPPDILKGLGLLALSAGLVWFTRRIEFGVNIELVVYVLASASLGLSSALGAREVTLHRVSERASWRWGLGVPLFSRSKEVADTDRVQLVTSKGTPSDWRLHTYSVHLAGVSTSETLAGGDDYDEALELAEAVARHLRRGLQVDNGRVRPFEELLSPERARAMSELGARLRGPGVDSALASTAPVEPPSPAPPGCRVQVREAGEQRVVEFPAPGWEGDRFRLRAGACSVVMLAPVVLAGYMLVSFGSWRWPALLSPFLLLPTVLGGFFLLRIWEGVHSSWRITVSRRGLELESAGPQVHPPTRWAAGLIQDVDVREQTGDTILVSKTTPMLVIARRDGRTVALGEGLPREQLEWAAARIRQELAALTGDKLPASKAG